MHTGGITLICYFWPLDWQPGDSFNIQLVGRILCNQNPVEFGENTYILLEKISKILKNLESLRRNNRILKPNFIQKNSVTVSVTEIWPVNRGYGYTRLNRDTPSNEDVDVGATPSESA